MNEQEKFNKEKEINISKQGNLEYKKLGIDFIDKTLESKYSYNFNWLGIPIIQYPQDLVAMQEIIWETKPDLLIETGIAHGGSLIFYASLFEIIGNGHVLGIDIDIRSHNKLNIEHHSMFKRITMIEGSSTSDMIVNQVKDFTKNKGKVMVVLDSNHSHEHVSKELELYSSLVSENCYLVVFDTIIEDLAEGGVGFPDRPWGKGNNPKTAVYEFLKQNPNFIIDKNIENKLLITVAPSGYLKRVK